MKFSQLVERASALRWQQKTGGGGGSYGFAHAPTGSKNFSSVRWYWAPQLLHSTTSPFRDMRPRSSVYALRLADWSGVSIVPSKGLPDVRCVMDGHVEISVVAAGDAGRIRPHGTVIGC
jgi:hypothetical protein